MSCYIVTAVVHVQLQFKESFKLISLYFYNGHKMHVNIHSTLAVCCSIKSLFKRRDISSAHSIWLIAYSFCRHVSENQLTRIKYLFFPPVDGSRHSTFLSVQIFDDFLRVKQSSLHFPPFIISVFLRVQIRFQTLKLSLSQH